VRQDGVAGKVTSTLLHSTHPLSVQELGVGEGTTGEKIAGVLVGKAAAGERLINIRGKATN